MKVRIEPIDYNVMKIKIAIYCDSVCAKRFELKSVNREVDGLINCN